jgi:tRNA 2-thiouridine synthesizing protein A
MSIKTVDARGLSCPQPVVMTREAVAAGDFPFAVVVDTEAAKENVARFVKSCALQCNVKDNGDNSTTIIVEK